MNGSLGIFRIISVLVLLMAVAQGCTSAQPANPDLNQPPPTQIPGGDGPQGSSSIPSATAIPTETQSPTLAPVELPTFTPVPMETPTVEVQENASKPFLMVVEEVFSIKGRGTVLTGHIQQGTVKVGDTAAIIGFQDEILETVITGLEMFQKSLEQGIPGNSVGILVRGIEADLVQPGMLLTQFGAFNSHEEALCSLRSMGDTQEITNEPLLMVINRSFVIKGRGTVLTGCISRGTAVKGKSVVLIGFENQTYETNITGVEMFQKIVDTATPGDYVGILVSGIDVELVKPGMILAETGSASSYEEAILEIQ